VDCLQPELGGRRGGALNQAMGKGSRGGAEGVGGSGERALAGERGL